jgi:hypothetical protein
VTKKELCDHPGWASCTFEGAEMSTLAIGLETTFREKLQWLEDAETLILEAQANQKKIRRQKKKTSKRKN